MKPSEILESTSVNKRIAYNLGIKHGESGYAGQLGPTEKVKNNNIGKLVGANENFINTDVQAVVSEEDLDEHNHLIGIYRKGESQFQLWNEGQYQYKLTSMVGGVPKQYKQWDDFDLDEVKASLMQSGFQSMRTFTDESTKMDKNNLPKQYWDPASQSTGSTPVKGLRYADPDEDGVHYPDYGNTNKPPRKFRVKDNDGDTTTNSRYNRKGKLQHRISIDNESVNHGVAEGMFTKAPAIDPTIGKQINDIINRLHHHAKRTKDEYLRAQVSSAVQELFDILRNTGTYYSPPGSPGVRDVAEGADPTTDSARDSRGDHRGEVKKNKDGSYVATNQSGSRKIFTSEKAAKAHAGSGQQGVAEGSEQQLSIQQLATISDEALDNAYGYGRSTLTNTFGWQANLASASYAKQKIDKGVTDIEAISDAIHKGWWSVAQKFVDDPDQFSDTEKLRADGKFDTKMSDRIAQMVPFDQLTKDKQDIDRVVARALLQAIKGKQGMMEGKCPMCVEAGTTCKECSMQMESLSHILRNAGIKKV